MRMNSEGEMAVLTGQGTAHAAATIMAVGLDHASDFSHAYWMVAGIAGGCPDHVSLGSATLGAFRSWTADLGYEIDAREIPSDWSNRLSAAPQGGALHSSRCRPASGAGV